MPACTKSLPLQRTFPPQGVRRLRWRKSCLSLLQVNGYESRGGNPWSAESDSTGWGPLTILTVVKGLIT